MANKNTFKDFPEQEVHNDLVATWNEVEEAHTSLRDLSNEEIIENKEAIMKRLEAALHWLGKYVSEEDIIGIL